MINSSLISRLRQDLWHDRVGRSRLQFGLIRVGRYGYALARDLFEGQLSMRSMSLVYTTLLSLVPFLALGFSVLKALGVHNTLEPVLRQFLRPLGPQGAEITSNLIGFVEKIEVGVLGSVGVALLFYTAISLIQKVESSFNFIWRITRPRPFAQRIGEYLGVLMVGPVVVFSALGMTASVLNSGVVEDIRSIEPFGFLLYSLTRMIPYAMIVGMFTFLYAYIPNTKVNLRSCAIGGVVAGVLWQTASFAFASFVASATEYNAIYSGFAIVIFMLIWLYVGWLILLIGCKLTFYLQNPAHLNPDRGPPPQSGRHAEYLALMIMGTTGRRFIAGLSPLTQEDLARELGATADHLAPAIETLIQRGYLAEAGRERTQLVPARDLDGVTLGSLWRDLRAGINPPKPNDALGRDVLERLDVAEQCFVDEGGGVTLREWLRKK